MSLASRPIVSSVVTDPFQYGIRFAEATYSLMMRHFHGLLLRLPLAAVLALLAVLFGALPAQAAYPRLILISGAEFEKPVVLDRVDEIVDLTTAIATAPAVPGEEVDGRAYLRLSLFWGDALWEPYVREGRLDELRPEQANQEGRFYPTYRGRDAVIDLLVSGRPGPKRAPKEALAILARNGVPTSFPAETHRDQARWPWVTGGVLAGLATLGGIIAFRRRSRSAPV
jgi:hypothetical protein